MKILALIAFRDEAQNLPGFFRSLEGFVDGIVCFDDWSQDDSCEIAQSHPLVIKTLSRMVPSAPHLFEIENRLALFREAQTQRADWILACDADERFERNFLEALKPLAVANAAKPVHWVRFRELWNDQDHYRADGVWAAKTRAVFFPSIPFDKYHTPGQLHHIWPPPALCERSTWTQTNYNLYHLACMLSEGRKRRVAKFKMLDPHNQCQPTIGYDYMLIESGIQLETVPLGRGWQK